MVLVNDERRRVAHALREMETPTWPTLTEAVMGHVAAREKVMERLAELIEPSYEPTGECVNPLGEFFGEDCPYCEDDGMECFENEGSYYKDGVRVIDCGPCRYYHSQDTTTDTTKSPELTTKCDRDALLELADEMDVDAGCNAYVDDYNVNEYARRIREACGVEP